MSEPTGPPRVSAIIPCYNGERCVADAVESVLAQTEPRVEAIVVDDASPDASARVLEPLLANPRVRLLRHEENRGIAAARNTGIRASRAEFIGFLDQDDLWLPDKTERQLAVFDSHGSDIGLVLSPVDTQDMDGTPLRVLQSMRPPERLAEMSRTDALRALYRGNFVTTASVLVRRSCFDELGLLDEAVRGGSDDYEFWLRLATRYRLMTTDGTTAVRRLHDTNVSSDRGRLIAGTLQFIGRFGTEHEELRDLVDPKLAWLHARLGSCHRNEGRYSQARASYRESLRHVFSARTFALLVLAGFGPIGRMVFSARRGLLSDRP